MRFKLQWGVLTNNTLLLLPQARLALDIKPQRLTSLMIVDSQPGFAEVWFLLLMLYLPRI